MNPAGSLWHQKLPNMKVLIPTPLRHYTDKQAIVELRSGSVDEVLRELTSQYPDLRKQLFADDGRLRKFVNVYVNDEDIRYLENENTPVRPDDTLSIIPSVAGGCIESDRAISSFRKRRVIQYPKNYGAGAASALTPTRRQGRFD
jgi:molybdopterin synthase sulfur carrier subunit